MTNEMITATAILGPLRLGQRREMTWASEQYVLWVHTCRDFADKLTERDYKCTTKKYPSKGAGRLLCTKLCCYVLSRTFSRTSEYVRMFVHCMFVINYTALSEHVPTDVH